jgi:predicted Zn-dependent peptidase
VTVPALTKPRKARRPSLAERTLDSGLRVIAVRKPGVPLAELRLRIPALSSRQGHAARIGLLSETMLTGADGRDRAGIAGAVQALGGDLSVSVDADRLVLGGNVLATNLPALLQIVAGVLTTAEYPAAEVATERDRLVERLAIARSRPGVVASEALGHRMWGEHPYAADLPLIEQVQAATPAQVRRLHADVVRPDGAVLVIVGDVSPNRALDQAERALVGWTGTPVRGRVPALPEPPAGPLLVLDRPGSVQSSLRLGGPALPRSDGDYPALQLANLVFGGYFSSRWTENIREDKGYTYGPHSRVEHHVLGSSLRCDVEVATEVTAPAVLETRYELGRIAALPVTAAEVDAARQYAIGTLAVSIATQAGLAATLSALAGVGLGLDWVLEHPARLSAVGVEEVSAAAARFFAPARLTGVIVGDADLISGPLAALGPVEA